MTTPGILLIKAIDNGNEINFNKSINTELNYSEFIEQAIIYSFIIKDDITISEKYSFINEENLIDL